MAATNAQVQVFVDSRLRPRAEQIRDLLASVEDDQGAIGEVYANVNDGGSTWTDARTDGPPALLTRSDVLAMNTVEFHLARVMNGGLTDNEKIASANEIAGQMAIVRKACVRPVRS